MLDYTDKTILITGGSRGIGAAAAKMFSVCGGDIAIVYRSDDTAAGNVKSYVEKNDQECLTIKADLSKMAGVVKAVDETLNKFGKIDILVNNHGIWNEGPIDTMTEEVWDEMMDVNLKSFYMLCHKIVPHMKERNEGRIINLTSTAGQRGEAYHSHYAATKGGIISFTKSLSSELAPNNILVNGVAPGWVDTDLNNEVFSDVERKKKIIEGQPLGSIPKSEDIAGAILFLASHLSNHITGEIINVNGGSVLCG